MYVDWVTLSSLATAGGTLVLAVATFASVRSANSAARVSERTLQAGIRPVLVPSRLEDPPEKIGFMDGKWVRPAGGHAIAEVADGVIYLAIPLRNVGTGLAVLHGWYLHPDRLLGSDATPTALGLFHRLTRDLYVPAGYLGFWQGALRDATEPGFPEASAAIAARRSFTIDLLYGDYEGGQRMISRFGISARDDGTWLAAVARHWNVDRANPR